MLKFKTPRTNMDEIEVLIQEYSLAKHPEHFATILSDLNLLAFWNTLLEDNKVFVIQELAIDRALNFYEGATCSGLDLLSVKVGVLCAIMSCVMSIDKNALHPHVTDLFPLFCPSKQLKLIDYPFGSMSDQQVDLFRSVMFGVTRGITDNTHNSISKKVPDMGRVFVDSLKMWVFGSERIKQLVALSEDRRQLFPDLQKTYPSVAREIRWANTTAFKKPPINHTLSLSQWGRMKLFKGNAASILSDIAKQVNHKSEERYSY